jgi:hypothetical protein
MSSALCPYEVRLLVCFLYASFPMSSLESMYNVLILVRQVRVRFLSVWFTDVRFKSGWWPLYASCMLSASRYRLLAPSHAYGGRDRYLTVVAYCYGLLCLSCGRYIRPITLPSIMMNDRYRLPPYFVMTDRIATAGRITTTNKGACWGMIAPPGGDGNDWIRPSSCYCPLSSLDRPCELKTN